MKSGRSKLMIKLVEEQSKTIQSAQITGFNQVHDYSDEDCIPETPGMLIKWRINNYNTNWINLCHTSQGKYFKKAGFDYSPLFYGMLSIKLRFNYNYFLSELIVNYWLSGLYSIFNEILKYRVVRNYTTFFYGHYTDDWSQPTLFCSHTIVLKCRMCTFYFVLGTQIHFRPFYLKKNCYKLF